MLSAWIWSLYYNSSWPHKISKPRKKTGGKFVIALKGDGLDSNKERYRFNQEERAIALSMLNIADEIVLLKGNELSKAIEILNPKFWF